VSRICNLENGGGEENPESKRKGKTQKQKQKQKTKKKGKEIEAGYMKIGIVVG
jgi:hypothetical protein